MYEQRYSATALEAACLAQCEAEILAGVQAQRSARAIVLAEWTAWLLMDRAGMPRDLIAYVYHTDLTTVTRGLQVATARLIWRPHAARIEKLTEQMPRFGAPHAPATQPKEAACAVPAR
jgi:hypothetical protein